MLGHAGEGRPPELIEAAGRQGFLTLSVRPHMVIECGLGETGLRRRLADAGVRVRVIDALAAGMPGMEAATAAERTEGQLKPADEELCFRTAAMVDCPIINVSLWGGQPAPLTVLADAIGATAVRAGARGLRIVLEFVPGSTIPDIAVPSQLVSDGSTWGLKPYHRVASDGHPARVAERRSLSV